MGEKRLVKDLIPHEKNGYYFDDMTGTKWEEFLDSVRTSGVIEPVVITDGNVIVSGHQRRRACVELGIPEVEVSVRSYENEDAVLKDLLETNVRQRGNIDSSALKLGRIIVELERLYGVEHGNNQRTSHNGNSSQNVQSPQMSQEELFSLLGLSKSAYHRAKSLLDLIPELQDALDEGKISATTASSVIAKLSPEQQQELFASMPKDVKLSQKEVQEYIAAMLKERDEDIEDMCDRIKESKAQVTQLRKDMEIAHKETEAYKKKLNDKERDIAGEFIHQRDLAQDRERKAYEAARKAVEDKALMEHELNKTKGRLDYLEHSIDTREVPSMMEWLGGTDGLLSFLLEAKMKVDLYVMAGDELEEEGVTKEARQWISSRATDLANSLQEVLLWAGQPA